jgi:acetyl esterase
MPLHPQCQAVLEAAAKARSAFEARDAAEARRLYNATTARFTPATPALDHVADDVLPGPAGPLPIRIYRPRGLGGRRLPVVAFFHGGGWVFGDRDSHDGVCRILAHQARALVVSLDYRLAPEHRFPAAYDDCLAATRWLFAHAGDIGGDARRIALAGDSAGGNLAAAACIGLREAGDPAPVFQLLIYPAVDLACDSDSHRAFAEGYLLTRTAIDWCTGNYLSDAEDVADWRASPLRAPSHAGLPPALVQTAEFDPLRDEGEAYAQALARAGVACDYRCYPGMIHGFVRMGALVDDAATALADGAAALGRAFATS